ncbi:MAG: glycosyltransferase family 2 protein [Patescibacteria group bacterium]|nr:glycosyltransferase family 2 protein [Patescibacteria group bacterium]
MKVIGVIPAYNEETRIQQTVDACLPFVDELIIVDDGSADETYTVAKAIPGVYAIRHAINRGQGAALRTGTRAALSLGADVVAHLDADGQHDPSQIPTLTNIIKDNQADVVFGSRFLGQEPKGMPASRRFLLWGGRWFNTFAQGIPRSVTDPQSGFRAFSASAAKQIAFKQDRMAHASEILKLVTRSNLRWREVPIQVTYTPESLKKGQKNTDALKIAWQLLLGIFTKS